MYCSKKGNPDLLNVVTEHHDASGAFLGHHVPEVDDGGVDGGLAADEFPRLVGRADVIGMDVGLVAQMEHDAVVVEAAHVLVAILGSVGRKGRHPDVVVVPLVVTEFGYQGVHRLLPHQRPVQEGLYTRLETRLGHPVAGQQGGHFIGRGDDQLRAGRLRPGLSLLLHHQLVLSLPHGQVGLRLVGLLHRLRDGPLARRLEIAVVRHRGQGRLQSGPRLPSALLRLALPRRLRVAVHRRLGDRLRPFLASRRLLLVLRGSHRVEETGQQETTRRYEWAEPLQFKAV